MLAAIAETTLGDDVFREDQTTRDFEAHVAAITGREDGMFVITGTMANQLSLHELVSTTPSPCGILCDSQSHIINFEAGGPSLLSGGFVQPITPANGKYLTVQDLEKYAILAYDVHKCPSGILSMENTNAGYIVPVSELREICNWAQKHGIKTHLDGARLFEAVATGAGSLRDYCTLVDLVTVDFSKNLGAPMGAMVLGDANVIKRMRRTRKAIGGGMRQAGVLVAAAREALFENFGRGEKCEEPVFNRVHELAKSVGAEWVSRGGVLSKDIETNQVWIDIEAAGIENGKLVESGRKHGVALDSPRIVLHHQIDAQAVADLIALFDVLLGNKAKL